MRIFNGTNSHMDIPLSAMQRIQVPAMSVSGDFMPNEDFLALMVTSYTYDQIALIVSGPFEIGMASRVSAAVGFVVQSLDEAIERFNGPKAETEAPAENVEEPVAETPSEIVKEEATPEAPIVNEEAPKKTTRRKKATGSK